MSSVMVSAFKVSVYIEWIIQLSTNIYFLETLHGKIMGKIADCCERECLSTKIKKKSGKIF